jgi:hypothetical protein
MMISKGDGKRTKETNFLWVWVVIYSRASSDPSSTLYPPADYSIFSAAIGCFIKIFLHFITSTRLKQKKAALM